MANAFTASEIEAVTDPLFVEQRTVRFQDIDAAGIIFYPRVLEYFSDAYMAMLAARSFDVPAMLRERQVGLPLVHAEADYRSPLRFGDAVEVQVAKAKVGETSFTLGYRVYTANRRIASLGQTVHVCIDGQSFRPRPLPEALRALLSA